MTPRISWPRRSTLVLLAIFLAALVTYGFVRPAPEDAEGAPARQETAVVDEPEQETTEVDEPEQETTEVDEPEQETAVPDEPAPAAEPFPSTAAEPDVEPPADVSEPADAPEPALPDGTQPDGAPTDPTAGSDGAPTTPAS